MGPDVCVPIEQFAGRDDRRQTVTRRRDRAGRKVVEGARRTVRAIEIQDGLIAAFRHRRIQEPASGVRFTSVLTVPEYEEQLLTRGVGFEFEHFSILREFHDTR